MLTVGKSFDTALRGCGEAKEALRVALSPHIRTENKRTIFKGMLKSCPEITRFQESRAALWLLQE